MKVLRSNGEVYEGNFEEKEVRQAFWHTSAHMLAQAVKELYPDTKCAIGPAIENGFYYDFRFSFPFEEEHLKAVEEKMYEIAEKSLSLQVYPVSGEEALAHMEAQGECFKKELIEELMKEESAQEAPELTFYRQGAYTEFCRGPHIVNTSYVKAVKFLNIAGAYWRGDEKNEMLTRIYGISFPKKSGLKDYLHMLEEAKKRDHRRLGKELGLFMMSEEGPGFPFFLPKGMVLKNILIEYWRKIHMREEYQEISTPVMLKKTLWETSGHWEHYREKMYTSAVDGEEYAVKPMSCPGGMLVFKNEPRSYRDLPLRLAELGLVHRNEKSGQLHGLMRVCAFTQDDAHIFMTREQIIPEIQKVMRLIQEVYEKFGFSYFVELSTRPESSIGSEEEWELATNALIQAAQSLGMPYVVNEGDGAFYGPKLDFHLKDSIGRTWQCGTIQLDFQLPARFEAEYTGADGRKHRPIMIHRVVYGSMERFIGILIEHYAGKFPVWLAPVQAKILTVSDKYRDYGMEVLQKCREAGIRAEIDLRDEKLGYRIREAQLEKVPFMLIIGEKEQFAGTLSVRLRDAESRPAGEDRSIQEDRLSGISFEQFRDLCYHEEKA
ncbi:MAG: threonine--tRNA ligase [Lachnospiraceae bacterium]|nr:threonine--tRNA ligase [Lachnospiraceae bacterium]